MCISCLPPPIFKKKAWLSSSKHWMSCLPRLSPGMLRHHTYMRTSFSGTWVAPGLLERHTMCILVHSSCISFLLPPIEKKLAMPIHLKTLNVLSATSQPRNAATSHLYAHELLRHLGCTRATWETYNVHIGSFFMHVFSATTHRKKNLPCLSTSKH